jgi:hypothetical protein
MFIDALLLVSDAQAITADAASTNTIDLGAVNMRMGSGNPLVFFFSIDVAADITTGDETYAFQVIQSAAANLATPDILALRTIAAADLKAGMKQTVGIPIGTPTKRYLGAYYDVGGTTPTITVTAGVVPQNFVDRYDYYPGVF